MTTDLVRAVITEKRPFLGSAEKCFSGQKCVSSQEADICFEQGTFFFAQLFPFVPRTWCSLRSELFFGPEISVFAQKSDCYMTPILVNGPFVALGETILFPCWGRFLDFLFPSCGRFRKKNWSMRQKVSPHCGGTVCQ